MSSNEKPFNVAKAKRLLKLLHILARDPFDGNGEPYDEDLLFYGVEIVREKIEEVENSRYYERATEKWQNDIPDDHNC